MVAVTVMATKARTDYISKCITACDMVARTEPETAVWADKARAELEILKQLAGLVSELVEQAYFCRHCGGPIRKEPDEHGNYPCVNADCPAVKVRNLMGVE
jgi:hypothetical protein